MAEGGGPDTGLAMVGTEPRQATAIKRLFEVALGALAVAAALGVAAYRAGKHSGQTHYSMEDSQGLTPMGDQPPEW